MSWWLDLSDHPLHAVRFVETEPRQIAVWFSPLSADFYTEDSGVYLGTLDIAPPDRFEPASTTWCEFVSSLCIPSGEYIAPVDANGVLVSMSYDGRLRVYWQRPQRLILDSDGQQVDLACTEDVPLVTVGLDRDLGTVAALSAAGDLYFYQQHVYVGRYALDGVAINGAARIFLPDAAGLAVVVHERGALVVDLAGRVRAQTTVPLAADVAACAPGGQWVVLGERHSAMLRVYDADLTLRYQGRAHDVLATAQALQLMPRVPEDATPLDAVAVNDDGMLVFTLAGSVCCAHVADLPELPHPRTLF